MFAAPFFTSTLVRRGLLLCLLLPLLGACTALHTSVSKRDLDVQTRMSRSIWLTPVEPEQRTVWLDVRNTSAAPELDLRNDLASQLQARGYQVLDNADAAQFWLQINVRSVVMQKPEDVLADAELDLPGDERERLLLPPGAELPPEGYDEHDDAYADHDDAHHGSPVRGNVYLFADVHHNVDKDDLKKLAALAVVWWASESIGNALVKDVWYTAITDVQIAERDDSAPVSEQSAHQLQQGDSGSTQTQWQSETPMRKYRTTAVSVANKANLERQDAVAAMRSGLARALAGLF